MATAEFHEAATALSLEQWDAAAPAFNAGLEQDARALESQVAQGDAMLLAMPPKPRRRRDQQAVAAGILSGCRNLRMRFMQLHCQSVYRVLTARDELGSLPALFDTVGANFPGLVASPLQMERERAFPQADKDAREIDQAIVLSALLREPTTGCDLIERLLRPQARAHAALADFQEAGQLQLDTVHLKREGRAGVITMSNPAHLNAEDERLVHDLETAVDVVLLDPSLGVGVLRGGYVDHPRYAGRRVFCAGINLKEITAGRISYAGFLLRRELGFINKMVRGLAHPATRSWDTPPTIEKPWLAVVDTFAIGGGAQLALACDWVIAGADSYISLPAAQEGFVPGAANLRLGRVTGARLARQMILGGRKLEAASAESRLLIDEVMDSAQLGEGMERAAKLLDSPAVVANRRMLRLADEPLDLFRQYMAEFSMQQVLRLYDPDALRTIAQASSRRPSGAQ